MKMLMKKLFALTLAILLVASIGTIPVSAAETNVKITKNGQIVDSLNGVDAKYNPGTGNTNTGDLSCAGYVKRYYSTIYGVTVSNLLSNRTPVVSEKGYEFKEINSGFMVGDVVRLPGHWAIIKEVSECTFVLIEQNWKWKNGSSTYTKVNRTVTYGSTNGLVVFRLYKNDKPVNTTPNVVYETHLANIGWVPAVSNGSMSGTTGQSRAMEAVKIYLQNASGGIEYRSHCQDTGWETTFKRNGAVSGSTGLSRRMECIEVKLTGEIAKTHSILYRVHIQDFGWSPWQKDGAPAGTEGMGLRIEAIELKLVAK